VRRSVAVLAAFVVLAGCTDTSANANRPTAPAHSLAPLDSPGGACRLLEYDTVKATLGLDLAISAAAQQDNTYTCVLQPRGTGFPDLTLAVSPTAADDSVYKSTVQPKGATAVAGLGKVGFSAALPASGPAGPGAEVGWLAGNGRLLDLRLRLAPAATTEQAAAALPKLVELAKSIDLNGI